MVSLPARMILPSQLQDISSQFQIHGDWRGARPLLAGHINSSYVVTYDQGGTALRFLLQKINGQIFRQPERLMKNLVRVTAQLQKNSGGGKSADRTRRCLTLIPTRAGKPFYRDAHGGYWRTYVFIEGAISDPTVRAPAQAFAAGLAFGKFQKQLVDLPEPRLFEAIPHFHDTRRRLAALQRAVQTDACGRAATVAREIKFALAREPMAGVIVTALARRELPERITHNDAKFSNVLVDAASGRALCVVDLDTVMPGCALYDFGDLMRSTTNPAAEDERDLRRVTVRTDFFKKLAQGYYSEAGDFLTAREKDLLVFAGRLITYELGLRFLTDYLNGDIYFRTRRAGQNLDRCRAQFRLLEAMEQQESVLQKIVNRL